MEEEGVPVPVVARRSEKVVQVVDDAAPEDALGTVDTGNIGPILVLPS